MILLSSLAGEEAMDEQRPAELRLVVVVILEPRGAVGQATSLPLLTVTVESKLPWFCW